MPPAVCVIKSTAQAGQSRIARQAWESTRLTWETSWQTARLAGEATWQTARLAGEATWQTARLTWQATWQRWISKA